jgi:hypothetical protein
VVLVMINISFLEIYIQKSGHRNGILTCIYRLQKYTSSWNN